MNRRDFLRATGLAGVAVAVGFRADGPDIVSGVEIEFSESPMDMHFKNDEHRNYKYAWIEDMHDTFYFIGKDG